jgi:nitrogen fixation/metabolism regulation signal transduction histidine kinase
LPFCFGASASSRVALWWDSPAPVSGSAGAGITGLDMPQFILQSISIVLSIVSIGLWIRVARSNQLIHSVAWWPLSLFVSNLLFSISAIIYARVVEFLPAVYLNYWGQAIRIHMLIVFIVAAWRMIEIVQYRSVNGGS